MVSILLLVLAIMPFFYYLIAIYSSWRFFEHRKKAKEGPAFTPAVSNLKPIRGLDPEAYENFASFCRQDYPEYEIVFCVDGPDDPVMSIIDRLRRDFPDRQIRVLYGSGRVATNDKVAKLARLVGEAQHEVVVISDSDVRVRPDYLRSVVAPLADPKVGAVTCPYVSTGEKTLVDRLQAIGMHSDFYAGIFTARELDGVKFALGPTIATTRSHLAEFGGYSAIENQPADDLLVGRLVSDQGYDVELLPYAVETVADYGSLSDLIHKRLRWIVVMRHMRPWGHFGLLCTQGLPWSLVALAVSPTTAVAVGYLATYVVLRAVMTWIIGVHGLKQGSLVRDLWLVPVWDAVAFLIWVASFARRIVRWRGADYYIRKGMLVPASGK